MELISQLKKGDKIKGKTINDMYFDKNYIGIYFIDGSYQRYTKDSIIKKEEMITIKYYFIPSESEGEVVIDEEGMRMEFENKLEELVRTYK